MDEKTALVAGWLLKAEHDLLAARKLASGDDPYLDVAIFHCQQAAEKAVKGFLVFHDRRIEKTHDIQRLVSIAEELDREFSDWYEAAERLTPYSTEYRYPGVLTEPAREEFDAALDVARSLYAFVLRKLPALDQSDE